MSKYRNAEPRQGLGIPVDSTRCPMVAVPGMVASLGAQTIHIRPLKHGYYTKEAVAGRRYINALLREARELMGEIG